MGIDNMIAAHKGEWGIKIRIARGWGIEAGNFAGMIALSVDCGPLSIQVGELASSYGIAVSVIGKAQAHHYTLDNHGYSHTVGEP